MIGLLVVVGGGSALVETGTGSQIPEFTVTASLNNQSGGEEGDVDTAAEASQ